MGSLLFDEPLAVSDLLSTIRDFTPFRVQIAT
jgi:hypothetical protein